MVLFLRPATAADCPTLAHLFHTTVLVHGPQHYSPAQVQAWAATATDAERFRQWVLDVATVVALDRGTEGPAHGGQEHEPLSIPGKTITSPSFTDLIVGFGGLAADGHLTALYVRHDRLRQGVGTALVRHLLAQGIAQGLPRLYTEASAFSQGVFHHMGFRSYGQEVIERRGVAFRRELMEIWLPEETVLPSP